ncbi:glutaredoxin [Penicillium verhagenii]|uniref:glutaredoxin n=1 Tax=Penicillium verhagenii TaxID=1562060 RepID=UPI00254578CB|nr:glutaredoxin [Penicillium verhagenii]KAJ5930893.1 glutaredoxin [Penicillium verhagenii]
MSATNAKVMKIINENGVVIFSKASCPYCTASKKKLKALGAKYLVLELDRTKDGAAIQSALQEITNQRTVPNIFIKQKHIGGNSDLQGKSTSELKKILKEAGAL